MFARGLRRASAATAMAGAVGLQSRGTKNAESGSTAVTSAQPHFRFGLIADIQYCDIDDASNFAGTEVRGYRGTLDQAHRATRLWNSLPKCSFVVQLGDLIDGQNTGKYGEGLKFEEPQTDVAFERVAGALSACKLPIFHAVGNHELYNFDWKGLFERLHRPARGWHVASDAESSSGHTKGPRQFYFSWRCNGSPDTPSWTMIMLNCYEVSLEQDKKLPGYKAAASLLAEHNPVCFEAIQSGKQGMDFFAGLEKDKMRFVPFNGGLGSEQLDWLRKTVCEAVGRGDRVVVFGHLPMLEEAASERTLLYDAEEAMDILHNDGRGRVCAVIAGHLHRGGYAIDGHGVHHLTLQSPLNFNDCFGYAEVYDDRLEIVGSGGMRSYSLRFAEMRT